MVLLWLVAEGSVLKMVSVHTREQERPETLLSTSQLVVWFCDVCRDTSLRVYCNLSAHAHCIFSIHMEMEHFPTFTLWNPFLCCSILRKHKCQNWTNVFSSCHVNRASIKHLKESNEMMLLIVYIPEYEVMKLFHRHGGPTTQTPSVSHVKNVLFLS